MKLRGRVFNGVLKLFLMLICVGMLLTTFDLTAIAQSETDFIGTNAKNNGYCCAVENRAKVSLETEKYHFSNDENILVAYYVNTEECITDISYTQMGFNVISVGLDDEDSKRVVVELSCVPNAEVYSLSIQISLISNCTVTAKLYVVKNEHGVFISSFSEDDAVQRYLDYAKETNLISQEEYENKVFELNRRGVIETGSVELVESNDGESNARSLLNEAVGFTGRLLWIDDLNNVHPLRHVMVKIYVVKSGLSNYCLATTYSTDEGGYSCTVSSNSIPYHDFAQGACNILIRVYAGDENIMVKKGNDECYYTEGFLLSVESGMMVTQNFTVNMSGDVGKAFQISQSIITARDYASEMMGTMPEDVEIYYPYSNSCYYYEESNRIEITGNAPVINGVDMNAYPNSYASWDVIMHEYGHHIQYIVENIDNPKLEHVSSKNNADTYGNKSLGIRGAWAESWPTVFGMMAQQYYRSYLVDIKTTADTYYTAYNGANYDIENNLIFLLGEACEDSIISFLWDLYDSNNGVHDPDEKHDNITLSHAEYWTVTTGNQSKTFSDFISYFYSQYPEYIDDIGPSLAYYNMATTKPTVVNCKSVSQNTPPKITWTAQGGSMLFPNNKFALIFYNDAGEEILRIENIYETTYELKPYEWNAILYNCTDTFTVAVAAYSEGSTDPRLAAAAPTTGPYISARSCPCNNPNAGNVQYCGIITNELRWCISTDDGTLMIYGVGAMPEYGFWGAPWYQYRDIITCIRVVGETRKDEQGNVIAKDIELVGLGFCDLYNVKDVELSGVDVIGQYSFYECTSLANIIISSTVERIESYAFYYCPEISHVTIPSSVVEIEKHAFRYCDSLIGIKLESLAGWTADGISVSPESLLFPDMAAQCFLTEYYGQSWTRDNNATTSLSILDSGICGDGVYWALSSEYELRIYGSGEMYDFTSSPWAMYSDELTAITVASGVTHIGNYAFENCGNVTVMLFEGVLSIGESAFKGCLFSDITLPYSLTTIGAKAFAECSALTKIDILPEVTYIGERAFENCSSLTVMTVDSGNTIYSSLRNCIIEIASKTIIAGCNGSLISKDDSITAIGRYAFSGCDLTTVYIPSTITRIECGAFYGCSELTSVTVSINLTVIGESAFEDCTSLGSIAIPENVAEIGANAFNGCTALTEVTIPASVKRIGEGAFAYSGITALNFLCANDWSYGSGNAVSESTLENASFAALLLKDELVNWTIVRDPLMSEALTSTMGWEISRNGTLIIYGSGCMPSYTTTVTDDGLSVSTAPWAAYANLFNALKIREGIYSIGRCAFYDLDNILTVSLPESLMVIDEYAFYECSGFSEIHIPARVFSIGIYTMRRTAVTTLTLGSPLGWTVNGIALSGDADEFYAHISGAVSNGVTIESYKHVFKHADLIEGSVIASGTFADGAMSWSLNDKGVLYVNGNGAMPTFNTGATPWADYRIVIRHVVIGEGVTTVGRCAFYNCVNVESAVLPSTVQEICEYAFYKCTTLSHVTLCEGLTTISDHAFNSCSALTEIDIPSTVTFIADNAFNKSGVTIATTA